MRNTSRESLLGRRQWWWWACSLLPLLLLSLTHGASGNMHSTRSLQKVMDIPAEGVQLCVTPLDDNTKLQVTQELKASRASERFASVGIRKRWLGGKHTLNILDIEVYNEETKTGLRVKLNGVLRPPHNPQPAPQPRPVSTALELKGSAIIAKCPVEMGVEGVPAPPSPRSSPQVPTVGLRRGAGAEEGGETEGAAMTDPSNSASGSPSPPTDSIPVTLTSSVTPSNNTTTETEEPETPAEPWWAFLLVLGDVGGMPVLVLLVICVFLGAGLGGALVCLCRRVCRRRRRRPSHTPVGRSLSTAYHADVVRGGPLFWDSVTNTRPPRSSGFGSQFSTLTNHTNSADRRFIGTSSNTSTANSRLVNLRPSGSANSSLEKDPSLRGMNNLGKGGSGSANNSIERGCNTPNIPHGSSVGRSHSNRSNQSTSSSVNRNINNRSPIILHNTTVGKLAGNRSPKTLYGNNLRVENTSAEHHKLLPIQSQESHDSDDSNYDRPYISPPIIADTYSVPHSSEVQPLVVDTRPQRVDNQDTASLQPPDNHKFGTFKT